VPDYSDGAQSSSEFNNTNNRHDRDNIVIIEEDGEEEMKV
jgi:hypothetical protein